MFPARWQDWNQRRLDARQPIIDEINDRVQRMLPNSPWVALFPQLIQLAPFVFAEEEPHQLTMREINPMGYMNLWSFIELKQDEATFPTRWNAWNQRRVNARQAIVNEIRANPDIDVKKYPEIVSLLDVM